MTRFFVDKSDLEQALPRLEGENAAHAKVLRMREGEQVVLCDGEGNEALCVLSGQNYDLEILERRASVSEPAVKVTLYMALPKSDKLEHVVQKATELGVYEVVTFPSARCVSKPDEKSLRKKLDRCQKIALAAAEQSGRGRIPAVTLLPDLAAALKQAAQTDVAVLCYENEDGFSLSDALKAGPYSTVSIMTGPEGGLEEREVSLAATAGLRVCTLGKRILRCETAPLCALSAVMFHAGEF